MAQEITWDSYYGEGDLEKINSFQKKNGIKFPQAYVTIVKKYNGAFVVDKNIFYFHSNLTGKEVDRGVGMFLPFGKIEGSTETMEDKRSFPPQGFPAGLVIFSAMGNGDAICFDYRENVDSENPPIVVWHHEGTIGGEDEISFVANSFDDFLELFEEEEY
jgi:SMI1 / KNR4 family (SUKH-1)